MFNVYIKKYIKIKQMKNLQQIKHNFLNLFFAQKQKKCSKKVKYFNIGKFYVIILNVILYVEQAENNKTFYLVILKHGILIQPFKIFIIQKLILNFYFK